MKARNLLILLAVAAILGFWAYRSVDSGRRVARPEQVGREIFADLPVNDVASIVITTPATNLVVRRVDQKWVVADRYGYPAKFGKVAETLMELRELKIGQVVPGGRDRPAEFNLMPPAADGAAASPAAATRLELRDAADRVMATLLIGKHFTTQPPAGQQQQMMMFGGGGYPSGQYVALSDGTVALVAKTLDRMIEPATSWLADEFINVPAADIQEVSITGPDRVPVTVIRDAATKTLALADLKPEEGSADAGKLSQLAGALNYLSFQDVANPALTSADTGMDAPVVFTARAADGRTYTLQIGKPVSENSSDRYVTARVAYTPPPAAAPAADDADDKPAAAGDAAEQARTLDAALTPWVYILRSHRLDNLLLTRDKLITPPPRPATTEDAPAPAAAPEPGAAVEPAAAPAAE